MTMAIEPPQASTSAAAAGSSMDASLHKTSRRLLKKRCVGMLARTTCIHPQLRDLLVCAGGAVVGTSYQHLARYTLPKRREPMQALSFIPNVLVQGCGILACGGQQAELFLRAADSHSHWSINTSVGKSINNSAHICSSPTQPLSVPRVLVCNNDCGIYRYDLHFPTRWGTMEVVNEWTEGDEPLAHPELDFIDRIPLSTPVNHASVSPDGRSMIAVGDTNEAFVYAISSQGRVTLIDTIEVADDASFSTSWSRSGDGFAIASQDGSVTIFDRRFLQPVKRFHSYQRGPAGAARVVKYSPGPHELLAFTEQKNYIHVIDARTYEFSETIYIPDVELEEVGRTGLSSSTAPLQLNSDGTTRLASQIRNDITGNLTAGTIGAGSRGASYSFLRGLRDNPWDTMPTDDAYQTLLSLQDCPPPSSLPSSLRDDSLLASLPSPARRPWLSGSARRSPVTQVSSQPTTVAAVLSSMQEYVSPTTMAINNMTGTTPGGSAITGLDWDESGSKLYACTERIILEWQVDSASRRSHPAATIL